jgi:archaellum biogenesis ATPase FlaH
VSRRPFYESFLKIYTQSSSAEASGLDQIAGMGYRKAFEFLIKDYAQYLKQDQSDRITKMPLIQVIKEFLADDKRLVDIASRAAWLGNDESHYLKKWIDKDISDLKKVIILTLQSIEHTEATNEYISSMPSPK